MTSKPPNILVFMTDQQRLSAVSAYGPTPCRTPNLDRLAAEGCLFKQAYCPASICGPSRASLFTGMLPHAHGMTNNIGDIGCNQTHIQDSPELLSRKLESQGYACGYTGKWHLCAEENKRTRYQADYILNLPNDLGFVGQDFHGHGGGGQIYPEFQDYLSRNAWTDEVERVDAAFGHEAGLWKGPAESTVSHFLCSHSLELIDRFQKEGSPWFIWHNDWGPHEPYFVPEKYFARYRDMSFEPWPDFDWDPGSIPGPHQRFWVKDKPWAYWENLLRYYYAFAEMIDDELGRILRHLEEIGELENTLIFFTSDHGESLGSHGGIANKGCQPFEEVLRVPLVVYGPGVKPGQLRDEIVANTDIYPTLCALAGSPSSLPRDPTRDLTPLLAGEEIPWRDAWVAEGHGVSGMLFTQRVLRWHEWIYVWNAGWPEMLFNLDEDPYQLNNLADQEESQEALQACRKRLGSWLEETLDPARVAFVDEIGIT